MTVTETVLGAVIALVVLGSFYLVFSRSVGSSLYGEDALNSLQAASIILEDIRREVMMASRVASPGAVITNGADEFRLEHASSSLVLYGGHGTVQYQFISSGETGWLEKSHRMGDAVIQTKRFADQRLREFSVWWVAQRQTPGANLFQSRMLCIILEVQGGTPAKPGRPVRVQTLVTPPFTAKEHSTWPG